jgi:hypothetical protein
MNQQLKKSGVKPWEQQENESSPAFEAFVVYRDLGIGSRSTAKVQQFLDKSKRLIDRWSGSNGWVERVRAYDAHLDEKKRNEALADARKMTRAHIKIAQGMLGHVVSRIQSIDPSTLSPSQLSNWFDTAVKIERLARGEHTDSIKNTVQIQSWLDLLKSANDTQ